jgi:hypothetical protein
MHFSLLFRSLDAVTIVRVLAFMTLHGLLAGLARERTGTFAWHRNPRRWQRRRDCERLQPAAELLVPLLDSLNERFTARTYQIAQ